MTKSFAEQVAASMFAPFQFDPFGAAQKSAATALPRLFLQAFGKNVDSLANIHALAIQYCVEVAEKQREISGHCYEALANNCDKAVEMLRSPQPPKEQLAALSEGWEGCTATLMKTLEAVRDCANMTATHQAKVLSALKSRLDEGGEDARQALRPNQAA